MSVLIDPRNLSAEECLTYLVAPDVADRLRETLPVNVDFPEVHKALKDSLYHLEGFERSIQDALGHSQKLRVSLTNLENELNVF